MLLCYFDKPYYVMFCARTLRIRNPPEDNESSLAPGLIHVLDLT